MNARERGGRRRWPGRGGLAITLPALIVTGCVAGAGVMLHANRDGARSGLERRFRERAVLASEFLGTYVVEQATAEKEAAGDLLAERGVSQAQLTAAVERLGVEAAVVLDAEGTLLAVHPPKPEILGSDLAAEYDHLAGAVAGRTSVSDVVPSAAEGIPIVGIATPYETRHGSRVFSGAFDVSTTPLKPYLESLIPIEDGSALLVDGTGKVVAASEPGRDAIRSWSTGYVEEGGTERYVAAADVAGTNWTLLASAPRAELLQPLEKGDQLAWVLLAGLALTGLLVVVLLVGLRARRRQLERRATECPVTGLANRASIEARIAHALRRGQRTGELLGVLYLDVDDFKVVNDTHGHGVGDELLRVLARRLEDATRATDTPSRIGGDEFAVLLEDIAAPTDAMRVATRVMYELEQPVVIDGVSLNVHASIGIAVSTASGATAASLLRDADAAMYKAKNDGKARIEVFEAELRQQIAAELELEADLRNAIVREQLDLHYQPIVDLASNEVVSMEALLRWHHPVRGDVPPAVFIPIAERNGLIVDIGRFVLRRACAQLGVWSRSAGPVRMCVNVSARQLRDRSLVGDVTEALAAAGVEPGSLTLEITETSLVQDNPVTSESLRRLKELGVTIAVDDFGAGYSSLSYLRRFPIDVLKIDRELVAGITGAAGEAALARAVVQLGQTLGLGIVAEGIESRDQLDALAALGCRTGQGFYFAKPAPAAAVKMGVSV
ncbi:MAG TPA: EAL domain-containing protein [Actinomycetota bacterium]|nr:EAL domain-containing protein [Actinomycetota bacterium]